MGISTPGATVFDGAIEVLLEHTAAEFAEAMAGIGIPCSVVMNYEMMEEHHHYLARGTWVEWDTVDGKKVKGITSVPRFKNHPSQIWRGCPRRGHGQRRPRAGRDRHHGQRGRDSHCTRTASCAEGDYIGGL